MFAKMKPTAFSALLCLLLSAGCGPPASSPFVATFNPVVTLSRIGTGAGVSYSNDSAGASSSRNLPRGTQVQNHWTFGFAASHAQLTNQLDALRAEVERQLSASGATISGRGTWSGDFSGFSFQYASGGKIGFFRASGVSLESGRQALEVLVYER